MMLKKTVILAAALMCAVCLCLLPFETAVWADDGVATPTSANRPADDVATPTGAPAPTQEAAPGDVIQPRQEAATPTSVPPVATPTSVPPVATPTSAGAPLSGVYVSDEDELLYALDDPAVSLIILENDIEIYSDLYADHAVTIELGTFSLILPDEDFYYILTGPITFRGSGILFEVFAEYLCFSEQVIIEVQGDSACGILYRGGMYILSYYAQMTVSGEGAVGIRAEDDLILERASIRASDGAKALSCEGRLIVYHSSLTADNAQAVELTGGRYAEAYFSHIFPVEDDIVLWSGNVLPSYVDTLFLYEDYAYGPQELALDQWWDHGSDLEYDDIYDLEYATVRTGMRWDTSALQTAPGIYTVTGTPQPYLDIPGLNFPTVSYKVMVLPGDRAWIYMLDHLFPRQDDDYYADYFAETDYENGYQDGSWDGWDDGYDDGFADSAYGTNFEQSHAPGINDEYDAGYCAGYEDGYNTGFKVGYSENHDEGYIDDYIAHKTTPIDGILYLASGIPQMTTLTVWMSEDDGETWIDATQGGRTEYEGGVGPNDYYYYYEGDWGIVRVKDLKFGIPYLFYLEVRGGPMAGYSNCVRFTFAPDGGGDRDMGDRNFFEMDVPLPGVNPPTIDPPAVDPPAVNPPAPPANPGNDPPRDNSSSRDGDSGYVAGIKTRGIDWTALDTAAAESPETLGELPDPDVPPTVAIATLPQPAAASPDLPVTAAASLPGQLFARQHLLDLIAANPETAALFCGDIRLVFSSAFLQSLLSDEETIHVDASCPDNNHLLFRLWAGGTEILRTEGVEVAFPYQAGEEAGHYFLLQDGMRIPAAYQNGTLTATLTATGAYEILFEAAALPEVAPATTPLPDSAASPDARPSSDSPSRSIPVIVAGVLAVFAGSAFLFLRKRPRFTKK